MSEVETIITEFIEDAPSGELKQVVSDLHDIAGPEFKPVIKSILESCVENGSRIETVSLEDSDKLSIVSQYNKKGVKYFDSVAGKVFNVNLVDQKAFDIEEEEEDQSEESTLISELKPLLKSYIAEHFPVDESQETAAYDLVDLGSEKYAILIANGKRSMTNFVNGNWVSSYIYNGQNSNLVGEIKVDVHYFEDGNVRLKTGRKIAVENVGGAKGIVAAIKKEEETFELELNKKFIKLNDVDFKGLRRPLPVTRAKINWGKAIGNYRLGKDVNA